MASPWALERFGGLAGAMSKLVPQAIGSLLERALPSRRAARATTDDTPEERRRALRHVVAFTGNSNQALLDTRWGEAPFTDYSAPVNDRSAAAGR
jgi:hypothetical protein